MSTTTVSQGMRPFAADDTGSILSRGGTSIARVHAGLAVLRVIIGSVFVAHGAQKLFSIGLPGLIQGFGSMGIPLPSVAAPSVALLELFGGLALVAGLFTRAAAVGLALVMLGAMLFVHLPAGFFAPNGIEFVLTLFGAAAALALAGPGGWSVDAVRARRKSA